MAKQIHKLPPEGIPNDPLAERKKKFRDLYKKERDHLKLARTLAAVESRLDEQTELCKELQAEYDVLRIEMLPELFEELGIENVKLDDLDRWDSGRNTKISGRVSLTADIFVHTADSTGLLAWMKKNKLMDWAKLTVNSSTLRAALKERMKAGKGVPPSEVVKVTPYTRASITKA